MAWGAATEEEDEEEIGTPTPTYVNRSDLILHDGSSESCQSGMGLGQRGRKGCKTYDI